MSDVSLMAVYFSAGFCSMLHVSNVVMTSAIV